VYQLAERMISNEICGMLLVRQASGTKDIEVRPGGMKRNEVETRWWKPCLRRSFSIKKLRKSLLLLLWSRWNSE
jgi:hypothetical protein